MRDYFKQQSAGIPKSRVYDPHSSTARRCLENEIATMLKQETFGNVLIRAHTRKEK